MRACKACVLILVEYWNSLKECTIRWRVRNEKSLDPKHLGALSPMAAAELPIVGVCIQMGKVRQPVNVTEAIVLANDLIKKTEHQDAVVEFQKARHLGSPEFEHDTLTKNWWKGFLRRHGHLIVTKRGERFAYNRSEWTNYRNIKQMYDIVYDEFVDARIAMQLEEPIWTDEEGNEVHR